MARRAGVVEGQGRMSDLAPWLDVRRFRRGPGRGGSGTERSLRHPAPSTSRICNSPGAEAVSLGAPQLLRASVGTSPPDLEPYYCLRHRGGEIGVSTRRSRGNTSVRQGPGCGNGRTRLLGRRARNPVALPLVLGYKDVAG
jgi:hypothetical protein